MAAEDLARALIRLDSDHVRHRVAEVDLSDFEEFGFELSDEERELLVEATARIPIEEEVAVTLPSEDRVEPAGAGGPGTGYGYFARLRSDPGQQPGRWRSSVRAGRGCPCSGGPSRSRPAARPPPGPALPPRPARRALRAAAH
jgi:hypothetical protein